MAPGGVGVVVAVVVAGGWGEVRRRDTKLEEDVWTSWETR